MIWPVLVRSQYTRPPHHAASDAPAVADGSSWLEVPVKGERTSTPLWLAVFQLQATLPPPQLAVLASPARPEDTVLHGRDREAATK